MKKNSPRFCWVSFGGPQEPWDAPEPYASMYSPENMPLPIPWMPQAESVNGLLKEVYGSATHSPNMSASDIAKIRANYAGNVTLIDDQIGAIIETIRRRGELDQTVIVFTSDHGEMNGDHGLIYKSCFLDPAVKVPLLVAPPASDTSPDFGQTFSELVELMDVGATLADYAGAIIPPTSQARSLRPFVERQTSDHRLVAISEFAGYGCAITRELKLEYDSTIEAVRAIDRISDPFEQIGVTGEKHYREVIDLLRSHAQAIRTLTPPIGATLQ